jgi:glycine/D-amino acid oxidase-like deaminating enzyme
MTSRLFSDDYKTTPYWWEETPRPELSQHEMPVKADVVVIGAGYTGLSAALQTSRGGRHTVVVDADDVGWGCSTKNGGQISTSIKPTYEELASKYGAERAFKILKEGHSALAWIADFVEIGRASCRERV